MFCKVVAKDPTGSPCLGVDPTPSVVSMLEKSTCSNSKGVVMTMMGHMGALA